jgi:Zn-dependent M28 family amino/carboxypeptidase
MQRRDKFTLVIVLPVFIVLILLVIFSLYLRNYYINQYADGLNIYHIVESQVKFGPRYVGSDGHEKIQELITSKLANQADQFIEQKWIDQDTGQQLRNYIARYNPNVKNRIIVATHYDTDQYSNKQREGRQTAVPGANDGASGTAILIYLGTNLRSDISMQQTGIDLVFLDAENFQPGDFNNWNTKGSEYFINNLNLYYHEKPIKSVFLDMVCKKKLRLKKESFSAGVSPWLYEEIWRAGKEVSKETYLDQIVNEIKDDHTNFVKAGIPSALLIDMDYPYHNTSQDTLDKCSIESLDIVYKTIKKFLQDNGRNNK